MSNANKLEWLSLATATVATVLVIVCCFFVKGDTDDLLWIAYVCMLLAWTLMDAALKACRRE